MTAQVQPSTFPHGSGRMSPDMRPVHASLVDVIEWRCERCGEPIHDREGSLRVDDRSAHVLVTGSDSSAPTASRERWQDPLAHPDRVRWTALHDRCADASRAHDYALGVELLRTPGQLLYWFHHITAKTWSAGTDIRQVIADILWRLGEQGGSRS